MKYVIISNRLPVTVKRGDSGISFTRSGGGLATGLDSLETDAPKHWIGWCGVHVDDPAERAEIDRRLGDQLLHPVYLSEEQIADYYEGYSNSTIWPLCHYFYSNIVFNDDYRRAYWEVNELFCNEAMKIVEPGDLVWIQDYQLMLLPGMIRERIPDVGIGYFHHIPFPSYELFRCLPERAAILRGLLGADLVGFHTHDYMRHFISAVYRVLNLECRVDEVQLEDRISETEAFPMGINYPLYHDAITTPEVAAHAEMMRGIAGESKVILSVDRLDYSKGILTRLGSYDAFLESHPEYRGKVTLLMVVVPSRDNVEMYRELKNEIDTQVGALNGKYATIGWTPVHYFYRSFSFDELTAMYHLADVALVTPLRDGMNLVAKEYLAAKRDAPGVLILSEMAGAADELRRAIIVNSTNIKQIEDAIFQALTMPDADKLSALRDMQALLARRDVTAWAGEFMRELTKAKARNDELRRKILGPGGIDDIRERFRAGRRRLLVFDYDGTLAPLVSDPAKATPTRDLLDSLDRLAADSGNTVVICSGRDKRSLGDWFPNPAIRLSAEHGAFFRENGQWQGDYGQMVWSGDVMEIIQNVTDHTPGSHIENKQTALVWHYRDVEDWLAELRVTQLINALMRPAALAGLQVMRGRKIVELKVPEFNKGQEIRRLLDKGPYDFIMAIGDDITDEDMFSALDCDAITIKVGRFSDSAMYCIPFQHDVLPFIETLAGDAPRAGAPNSELATAGV
ncbi:MAG: bifunctional alpha,alpha-trehalose-phosphate synthase (UDP-forming)/trehalose-phosphatase [Planctomycetes bacterium]|nr:bifunctional alpha,alpha-trehalose-phosphate synthase (UDP-forming)/trehalose-phosphatase [Planctomycetota bacterium]